MTEIATEHLQIALINIASNSENPTEALLSNLAYAPFEFEGRTYASVEAFWQGLKFPDDETRTKIATMHGIESKKVGNDAPKSETFVYDGQIYGVGSPEHQELMKRVIRSKLEQNLHILKLLLDSGDTEIVHRPVRKDGTPYSDSTTIPERIFSGFLMELREEFRARAPSVIIGVKDLVEKTHENR